MYGFEFRYEIVVPKNADERPRLKRKLRRSSIVDEDYIDPAVEEEYDRQVRESGGFDVDYFPRLDVAIFPCVFKDKYDYTFDMGLFARLGLHCYNLQNGTNLILIGINKYNNEMFGRTYVNYITLEAMDTSNNSSCNFQTCACKYLCPDEAPLSVHTELSRLKVPTGPHATPVGPERGWKDKAIDDFYKGRLPNWLTKDGLAASGIKGQFYELQQSDLEENEWLHLYAEFALRLQWVAYDGKRLKSFLPLDINKVIIQTKESGEESPRMKLKANNAIFYMSFKGNGDPSDMLVEYQAVVRRTMDGKPGHIRLEVDCLSYESNSMEIYRQD